MARGCTARPPAALHGYCAIDGKGKKIVRDSLSAQQEMAMARRYGRASGRKVKRAMHEMKRGKLRSGRSGRRVRSRKQAIAIGLSEARRSGAKVPKKKK